MRLLLTYVNPNVGFTGSSYLATNWYEITEDENVAYDYVDNWYVTRRELLNQYQALSLDQVKKVLGSRLTSSRLPLCPLKLFAYPVSQ